MEHVQNLLKTSFGEIEKLLSAKNVFGEPVTVEGYTIIPVISLGFGCGAGGAKGRGKDSKSIGGEGEAGGTGGGGGVKPVAVIVISKDGVSVEPIKAGFAKVFEGVAGPMSKAIEKCMDKCMDKCESKSETKSEDK